MSKLLLLRCRAFSFLLLSIFTFNIATAQYDLVVAKDGSGNHATVQAAIDAAPTGRTTPYKIFIKNGKYKEKITVPSTKPFIQLIGESVTNVILTFDDYSGKTMPAGGTFGTANSASVTVNAADFCAFNITFENTTGDAPQALAVNVNADRAAFKNCRFLGGQDTLLTNGNNNRQYFRNCYIDGVVDFIFGAAKAVFDSCVVYPKTRKDNLSGSYITAANTPVGQPYGYVFRDCIIPMNRGITTYVLARPWQNGCPAPTSYPKTVFVNTTMSAVVKPEGWAVWDACTNTSQTHYAEYKSKYFNGTLLSTSQRVTWSFQLTDVEASTYTMANIFAGWDPCTQYTELCTNATSIIAVSNFVGLKGTSTSTFNWNASWGIDQVTYELYRGVSQYGVYTKINEVIAPNDTTYNYSLTDANPPSGSIYYYYIKAFRAGFNTHVTDTVQISSAPTVGKTGVLNPFYQTIGTPSPTQSYIVSGTDLQGDVTITPPAEYEISNNAGANWYNSATPLVLTTSGGVLSNTTISVRLNATVANTYTGNITHTSTNAVTLDIPLSGTAVVAPSLNSMIVQQWPLLANNADDPAVRSSSVTASTPTFNKFYLSNGTQVAAVQPYSATHGQAFGATSNGDGSWGTAVGGPGGNLSRTHYEEFTVTATGNSVRIDSLILTSAFYNTSSNTKLGVVYSKTGFTNADSTTNTILGVDHTGASVVGTFASPIVLANQTGGATNTYKLSIGGNGGDTLATGETMSIRLYFSCGSTSVGRYGMLKNVTVKGEALSTMPLQLLSFIGVLDGNKAVLNWNTNNEVNTRSFVIERASTPASLRSIGTVAAANRAGINQYSFTDDQPLFGQNYYRLKMVDADGSYTYSGIIALYSGQNTVQFTVSPNPVKEGRLNFRIAGLPEGIFNWRIVNGNGQVIFTSQLNSQGSLINQSVKVPQLSKPGIYQLQLIGDQLLLNKTVIVQ